MNRRIVGAFILCMGAFSFILAGVVGMESPVEPGSDMGLTEWVIFGLVIGCFVLALNGLKWIRGAKVNRRGRTVGSARHYVVSLLVMYCSSCIFGSSAILLALQYQGGGTAAPEALMILIPVMALGFVTMVVVRQAMRDPANIELYSWDADSVDRSTGLLRVAVAMVLPVLIILLIMLLVMYVGLKAAASSVRYCPHCGNMLDANNYCGVCNIQYY